MNSSIASSFSFAPPISLITALTRSAALLGHRPDHLDHLRFRLGEKTDREARDLSDPFEVLSQLLTIKPGDRLKGDLCKFFVRRGRHDCTPPLIRREWSQRVRWEG
jgi:hypothetical protein